MKSAPTIVPLRDDQAEELLSALAQITSRGDVPLVGDAAWPAAQWGDVHHLINSQGCPAGIGWAALTSGSSGSPRIVLRSSASWDLSYAGVEELLGIGAEDRIALPSPASSSMTLFSLGHWLAGGPQPVLPGRRAVRPSDFAAATCFHGTPQAFRTLIENGVPPGMHSAFVGGSHLDPSLRQQAEAIGISVTAYYGAAELSLVAVDHGEGLVPFDGVNIELRGDRLDQGGPSDQSEVSDRGELWVRSPYVAAGYLRHDGLDSGASQSRGPFKRAGEWVSVGDRATWDNGRLRILGRADDAILSASATVVPHEVETALRKVEGVADVVVFGLPTPHIGALVAAVVEPRGPRAPTTAKLRRAAAELLSHSHRPRMWFAAEIPRTSSGKPARGLLAQRAAAGQVPCLE